MANAKWFDEVFLPSLEERMNNQKYPNQVILSEKQMIICEKYMKLSCGQHGIDNYSYVYDIGTKHYWMHKAGRYIFLNLSDSSKLVYFIHDLDTKQDIITFNTEQEMNDWIEKNVDDETGRIINDERRSWVRGCRHS